MTRSRDAVGAKITVPISHFESEVIDVSERKKLENLRSYTNINYSDGSGRILLASVPSRKFIEYGSIPPGACTMKLHGLIFFGKLKVFR